MTVAGSLVFHKHSLFTIKLSFPVIKNETSTTTSLNFCNNLATKITNVTLSAPWAKSWSFADGQSDLDLCRPLVKVPIAPNYKGVCLQNTSKPYLYHLKIW